MLLVPLHDLELAGEHAFHQAHLWGRRHEMLLAALRLAEQTGNQNQFDHSAIPTMCCTAARMIRTAGDRCGGAHAMAVGNATRRLMET